MLHGQVAWTSCMDGYSCIEQDKIEKSGQHPDILYLFIMNKPTSNFRQKKLFNINSYGEEKCRLIIKPTQSGKTWLMLMMLVQTFQQPDNNCENIHIIVCDNSIIQNEQLHGRINNLEEFKDGSYSCIVHNSKNGADLDRIWYEIVEDNCRIIVMCNNSSRMGINNRKRGNFKGDIMTILERFASKRPGKYAFHVWIDEADKHLRSLETFVNNCSTMSNMVQINMITATPSGLFKVFGQNINILAIDKTTNSNIYQCFSDSKFTIINDTTDYLKFMAIVLEKEKPRSGQLWFSPAEKYTATHLQMKDLLCISGFAVFVINGKEKALYMPYEPDVKVKINIDAFPSAVISDWIYEVYKDHDLHLWPVAITGHECISRGITITSEKLIISHLIFPPRMANDKSISYQMAGRGCGNYKKFKNYTVPHIFCTKEFKNNVMSSERLATGLAEYAFIKNKKTISKNDCDRVEQVDFDPESYTEDKSDSVIISIPQSKRITIDDVEFVDFSLQDVSHPEGFLDMKKEITRRYGLTWNPKYNSYFADSKKINGFYKTQTHGVGGSNVSRVVGYGDIRVSSGLGANNLWRIIISYKDLNNPASGIVTIKLVPSFISRSRKRPREEIQQTCSKTRRDSRYSETIVSS